MFDLKNLARMQMRRVVGVRTVTVHETNFGYIIRSAKGSSEQDLRSRVARIAAGFAISGAIGVWFGMFGSMSVMAKAVICAMWSSAVYFAWMQSEKGRGDLELHVDTSRREVRSAVVTPKGEAWIRSSARFGDVANAVLQKPKAESAIRTLSLRIHGDDEVIPVAVGEEKTLLAVHDRLMRDLRPIEDSLAGFKMNKDAEQSPTRRKVFPALGPDEAAA